MTDKKQKKSEKEDKPQFDNKIKEKSSGSEEPNVVKEAETKLIEGEEPRKLEYFSKEELINKLEVLEKDLKEKEKTLNDFQARANDWKNKYMRLQAEFENAQKRWDKNRLNLNVQYTASTLKSFLPLYDSFKKAIEGNSPQKDVLKGFYDQFMNILRSYKAEPIKVKVNDPFDYNYHEALSSIEKKDVPNNTIIDIIQDGWKLDKEVIRYAKVIVAREPKPPEPEPEEKEEFEEEEKVTLKEKEIEPELEVNEEKEKIKPEEQVKNKEDDSKETTNKESSKS
ncbi:MAG: nucleotide exchange factor GrpE [Promethearchaeota archaeon]